MHASDTPACAASALLTLADHAGGQRRVRVQPFGPVADYRLTLEVRLHEAWVAVADATAMQRELHLLHDYTENEAGERSYAPTLRLHAGPLHLYLTPEEADKAAAFFHLTVEDMQ